MTKNKTPKQARCERAIQDWKKIHGVVPSYLELAEMIGGTRANAQQMVRRMIAKGYLIAVPDAAPMEPGYRLPDDKGGKR